MVSNKFISALVFAGVVIAAFGTTLTFCRGIDPHYLDRIARLAPASAAGVAALLPPEELAARYAFDVTERERGELAIRFGVDPLDSTTWRRFGLNPTTPIGFVLWGESPRAHAIVFGAHGNRERGREELAAWLGSAVDLEVALSDLNGTLPSSCHRIASSPTCPVGSSSPTRVSSGTPKRS